MEFGSDPAVPSPPSRSWVGRHRLLFAIVVAVAVAVGTCLQYGPQLVARHVANTYLSGLNIDTSGVDTLRIRLLQGYLSFGPVSFGSGGATAGQVGRIGVRIGIRHLLQGQALVRSIIIEGVRFEIRQAEDGSFSLNGIPLGTLLAGQAAPDAATEAEPQTGPPPAPAGRERRTLRDELTENYGLKELEIRDSRVEFIDARGGEAVMHVHELDLAGFYSWKPEKPGKFRLDAELNDIKLTASGIARPFADKFDIEGEAAVTGIQVQRIERYLGPLGFTSQAGQFDLAVTDAAVTVFAAGRVDGRLAASGTLTGVYLSHPLLGSGQLATGVLRLDNISASYDASRQTTLAGDLDIDLSGSAFQLQNGTEAGFSHARFGLPGTIVKSVPGKQPELKVAPELDVADLRLGGAYVRGTVGAIAVRLNGFSIEGTEAGAPFIASGSVAVERVDLLLPHAEPVAVTAGQARVDLAETHIAFPPGKGTRVAGGVGFVTQQLSVTLGAAATPGRSSPPSTRYDAGRVAFELPSLIYDSTRGTAPDLRATGPRLSVADVRLGGAALEGQIGAASVGLARLEKTGDAAPVLSGATVTADRLDLLLPGDEPLGIATERLRAEIAEARPAGATGAAPLAASVTLESQDLRMSLQEQGRNGQPPPPPTVIEAARFAVDVPEVLTNAAAAPEGTMRMAKPRITVDRLRLGGADIQGTIRDTSLRLAAIDIETRSPGPPVIVTGKLAVRDMDLLVPDVEPIAIAAQTVDADLVRTIFAFPPRRVLIDGALTIDSRQVALLLHEATPADGSPRPAPLGIFAGRFAGELARLIVDERRRNGTRVTVITPALRFDQFRLEKPLSAKKTARLTVPALRVRRTDVKVAAVGGVDVAGKGEVIAPDLSVALLAAAKKASGAADISGFDANLERFAYRQKATAGGFGMNGRIGIATLKATLPTDDAAETADQIALARLNLNVADFDLATGDDPGWRARLDLDLGTITADLNGSLAGQATLSNVSLNSLDASSSERSYVFDRLALGRFDAALTRRAAPDAREPRERPARDEEAAAPWPPADLPRVKFNRASVAENGRISLVDETVTPAIETALSVDWLGIENVDTADANARTALSLRARLDDSRIRMRGWAEAFRASPSFQMWADVDALSLPTVWPIVAQSTGVDVTRGALTLDADATATDGKLDAEIRARLTGLRMRDRPNAETAEVTRALGEPLSTLIRLLEDRDGAIDVTLPVEGDLFSPDVRVGSAAWGLLPRALRALVTSPVRFISSTRSVVSAMQTDDAPPARASASTR